MVRDPSIVSPSLTGVFIGGGHNKHGTGSRCTLLKQCTYIVRDLGQQPTTWMGAGCCSTGGNQQRSQQCAEQVLQPGKEPARRVAIQLVTREKSIG